MSVHMVNSDIDENGTPDIMFEITLGGSQNYCKANNVSALCVYAI